MSELRIEKDSTGQDVTFFDDEGSCVGRICEKWFVPYGIVLTADELRQIAFKLDELNGTTQPSLLERVRELRERLTDQAEANGPRGRLDISQLIMEAVDELDCIFPELKHLSASEQ